MALPPFDLRGLLPPFNGMDPATADRSPYFCSMLELCSAMGTTDHRKRLLRNLIAYRGLLASDGYVNGIQFIDGSFVEDVERIEARNPNDIDIFSAVMPPDKYASDFREWSISGLPFWKSEIVNNSLNRTRFSLDCYGMVLDPRQPFLYIKPFLYWYSLFSHRRTNFEWKGFVAVALGGAEDQAALKILEAE